MSKFVSEFKEFISKGNAMDMAVGVIIGGAFTAIVTSLTDNILNPLIKLVFGGADVPGLCIPVPGTTDVYIDFGAFISAIINFLIIALVVFLIVKAMNKMREGGKKLSGKEEEAAPETVPATCPFCMEEVKDGATKCPHCGGTFDEPAASTVKEA